MTTIAFDTLAFAKKMKAAGFTEQQAEMQAEALKEILGTELATKKDLVEVKASLEKDIRETKVDIIKWVAGMLVAQAAIVATLVKLL